jgi:putative membrane protein
MKILSPVLLGVLALSGPSLAQGQQATKQPPPDKMVEALVGNNPQAFAAKIHHVNQEEIQLGQLAEKKGRNQDVREFGKHMVMDHTQADQQLMQLAKSQGWTLSEKPSPKNETERAMHNAGEATEAELKQLEGPLFDSVYMATMVAGHDGVIQKVSFAQKQFHGTPLGSMLSQLIPKLMEHREHAYRILGELKPEAAPMGQGGAGKSGSQMMQRK